MRPCSSRWTRTRLAAGASFVLLPLLLGSSESSLTPGLEAVTWESESSCLDGLTLDEGEVVWPGCFDDPSKAAALRAQLRKEGILARVQQVGRWDRVVRYFPMDAAKAERKGEEALSRRPDAADGMLEVVVDWEPELRSFVWDLEATCPDGWSDLGDFKLTAYVLAQEQHFASDEYVEACGLEGTFRRDFLFGNGVEMQGSGLTLDGRIVRVGEDGCFAEARCPLTASVKCARPGRTVAVDPALIPLGSELLIEGLGRRYAEDVGGKIKGQHIDVYYGTELSVKAANARTRHDQLVCVRDPA